MNAKHLTCKHEGKKTADWDYVRCNDCGAVLTGVDGWGIAKRQWFATVDEARFYRDHGRLPESPRAVVADLLAALQAALVAWNTQFEGEQDADPWCVAARDAIAKASGSAR